MKRKGERPIVTNGKNKICLLFLVLLVSLTACSRSDENRTDEKAAAASYKIDPEAATLTITGPQKDPVVYTEEDLRGLGLQTRTYSARGKEVKNARQFLTFSGVDLDTLLENAGYARTDASMKVFCSDGYVREYDVEDLFDLYTYEEADSAEGVPAAPMLALADEEEGWGYPCPFRLVYGQADYDGPDSMDFNMQGWARYVQCIEISY